MSVLADDETDFSTAPDSSWQRFDPLGTASVTFENEECRLACPAPDLETAMQFGLARVGLFSPGVYSECVASADLTGYAFTSSRSEDGCFPTVHSRLQSPAAIGAISSYALATIDLGNGSAQLQLFRLDGEQPTLLAGPEGFPITPGEKYRLVLISRGVNHTGRIFHLDDLVNPLKEVTATDATYASGRAGISVSTDRLTDIYATFDNYLVWDGTPPPLTVILSSTPGSIDLVTDAYRSLASSIEESDDLTIAPELWDATLASSASTAGGKVIFTLPRNGLIRFFRRRGM